MPVNKKTTLIIAGAAVVLFAAVILLVSGGRQPINRSLLSNVRQSGSGSKYYKAEYAFDGNTATAWSPGKEDNGKYSWIEMEFTRPAELSGISMINGFAKNHKKYGKLYLRNNRVKAVRIQLDDYRSYYWMLNDNRQVFQYFSFPDPVRTRRIRFYIHDIYPGNVIPQLFISEIRFH